MDPRDLDVGQPERPAGPALDGAAAVPFSPVEPVIRAGLGLDPLDPPANADQIPLFSNDALSYFWPYDNEGLKLAQFRFYEVPTVTPWTP
jgi:hypothetical protein